MFNIAVCDDEKIFREDLKVILEEYGKDRGIALQIDTFASGKEFIEQGIEIMKYKVVFLDVKMDEMDGIMTARKIREKSREIFIAFVTAYVDYSLEGYKVDVIRYILKDSASIVSGVHECLDAVWEKIGYRLVRRNFSFREGSRSVVLERILYIESCLHDLEFYIMDGKLGKYTLYGNLNRLEKELAEGYFLRVHQSYLVNMKYIRRIKRHIAVLDNGTELNIARARYHEIEKKFIAYRGEM